jgi:UDP-glucose 4-epimerase
MHSLQGSRHVALGMDVRQSSFTQYVGSITERDFVAECMRGVAAVLHTATLHKPHIISHSAQDFVDTNVTGTLSLLQEATAAYDDANLKANEFSFRRVDV